MQTWKLNKTRQLQKEQVISRTKELEDNTNVKRMYNGGMVKK